MKKISVILMCLCSLFLFTECYTNEFGENQFVDNREPDVPQEIDIETLKNIHDGVDKFFSESATIDEMAKHLDEIKAMKGIAEAWTTDDALYVKTNDGITCFWLYPNDLQADEEDLYNAVKQMTRSVSSGDAEDHENLKPQRIALINQQSSDEGRKDRITILNNLRSEFVKAGFTNVKYVDRKNADLNFFISEIAKYDIIFLITHGAYLKNDHHALLTGADVSFISVDTCKAKIDEAKKMIKKLLTNWRDGVSLGTVKEVVNGDSIPKTYFSINEDFITQTVKGSLNDAIIFNVACQSLKGSNSLADAFGAKTYIGYNETSGYGTYAGDVFFRNMLVGLNVGDAFEKMGIFNPVYIYNNATLKIVGSKNVCIIHPLVETTEPGEITSTTVELNGKMTEWRETLNKATSKVGFCWSSTDTDKEPKMDNANSKNSCWKFVGSYSVSQNGTCNFNGKMEGLSPNTTYYYRPFLYMNNEYYYGDVKEIKTKEEEKKEDDDIRAYLEKLYHDTDGDHWYLKDNWLSDTPVEEWYGVSKYQNGFYSITLRHNNLKGTVDLSGCDKIEYLECNDNNLTSLDVSGCTALTKLYCGTNSLTNLDISGCDKIESLSCSYNSLTNLDVSGYVALTELHCNGNNLTSLDVSRCTALTKLVCFDNNLTSFNASGCTKLKLIFDYLEHYHINRLDFDKLVSLNVSGCIAITKLRCNYTNLTSLDVSGCTALMTLECYDNNLTSLNASGCTALMELDCSDNNLTSLDISGCTALMTLECYDNNLTSLNASGCIALMTLNCGVNSLTNLNVLGCTALKELYCLGNHIISEIPQEFRRLDVFKHDVLYYYDYDYDLHKKVYKRNEYGWYYPGEPESMKHDWPSSDAPRRQIKKE